MLRFGGVGGRKNITLYSISDVLIPRNMNVDCLTRYCIVCEVVNVNAYGL